MHKLIPDDGLATRYAAAPRVSIVTVPDGRPRIDLEFASSSSTNRDSFRITRLSFEQVLEYHWMDFEFGLTPGNDRDVKLTLIEITDSALIRRILEEGKFSSQPVGQRAGGVIEESSIRHFRICFDDHGTYDFVCTGLAISYAESADHDSYS